MLNVISCRRQECHPGVAQDAFVNLTTAALSNRNNSSKETCRTTEALRRQRIEQQKRQPSLINRASTQCLCNLRLLPHSAVVPPRRPRFSRMAALIRESFQPEKLDSYKCDAVTHQSTKQAAWKRPSAARGQVKRFEGSMTSATNVSAKKLLIRSIDDDLWIVARDLSQAFGPDGGSGVVRQFQYRLRSVLFHTGRSIEAGHYMCSFAVPQTLNFDCRRPRRRETERDHDGSPSPHQAR